MDYKQIRNKIRTFSFNSLTDKLLERLRFSENSDKPIPYWKYLLLLKWTLEFAGEKLTKIDDNRFSFEGQKIEKENLNVNEIEVKIKFFVKGLTEEYDSNQDYSVRFGDNEEKLNWHIILDNEFIEELNFNYSFEDPNIDFSGFEDINEYIKQSSSSLEFLVDLSSDIEGLRFKFNNFEFNIDGETVTLNDFIIESGEINKLPEEEAKKLLDLLFKNTKEDKSLKVNIGGIEPVDQNDEFIIYPGENEVSANAEMNFFLEFEFVPDEDDSEFFIYRAEPTEIDIDQETREALEDNLESVEVVQEIVNELPLVGEIKFFIGSENPDNKEDFYNNSENIIYQSSLIDLRESDQKYRHEDRLGEGFVDALIEEGPLYVGFILEIPMDDNGESRKISFSINDMIELKMWSNVTVKVNSQN